MPTTLPSSTPSSDFTAPHSLSAAAAAVAVGSAGGVGGKGQLISEGNFGVFKSFKKGIEFFERFLP